MPAFSPHRFGQYTLTARLGRGGMADVYRARAEGVAGFQRIVVVKKILGSHNEDPQFIDMFINEAKIAARLTHPNIVQVYELGDEVGELFIVMEYVKGKDLLRLLRTLACTKPESPAVPPLVAAYIARETCRGLAHAHEHTDEADVQRPIVHRDVSPQNIMLSYDGHVKLVDFGIAKALDSMKDETRTGALKGKFAYMAPEQIGGHSPVPQSDIFSAGVVLHEMLTGRRLFKGATDYDTLQKVQTLTVPPPSALNAIVSSELDTIVLQALARDRDERYTRAAHMARDLDVYLQAHRFAVEDMAEYMKEVFPVESREDAADRAVSGSHTSAAPPDATQPSSPPWIAARRRLLAWVAAASLVLVVVVVAVVVSPLAGVRKPPAPTVALPRESPLAEPAAPPTPAPVSAEVRLTSEPPGAQVYVGPKLLGAAPVTLHLAPGAAAAVTLVHAGFEDLTYTVEPGDGPTLTLRLVRRHRKIIAPSPHRLHIDTIDNEGEKPHVPKVQAIED